MTTTTPRQSRILRFGLIAFIAACAIMAWKTHTKTPRKPSGPVTVEQVMPPKPPTVVQREEFLARNAAAQAKIDAKPKAKTQDTGGVVMYNGKAYTCADIANQRRTLGDDWLEALAERNNVPHADRERARKCR